MRRRLAILSLATTALVVISFLIPLGLLVRRQAENRARSDAERSAQSTVQLLALAASLEGATPETIEAAVGPLDPGSVVAFSDGTEFGERVGSQGSLVAGALSEGATISDLVEGGWELAVPVIGREGSAVVDVFVPDDELNQGVAQAWLLLAMLGLLLVAIAVAVADRMGQSLVRPIVDLASTARRLGEGDLDARARLGDPEEIRAVGESINWLAGRVEELLVEEREAAADLSHRLRTPLTALRLQAEKVTDPGQRDELLAQVDRLEEAIDQVILATRSERGSGHASSDLASVVSARIAFWRVLAEEQSRVLTLHLGAAGEQVALSSEAVEAMIDALIGNVFAHTAPGTAFRISVGSVEERPWLEVCDDGAGFPTFGLAKRGVSGAGSTGLGLDIVRRTAERVGGSMELNDRPGGGAVVRVWLGPVVSRTSARSRS